MENLEKMSSKSSTGSLPRLECKGAAWGAIPRAEDAIGAIA